MTYSLWKSVFIISHAKNIRQSSQQLFSEIVNGIPLENLPSCNLYRVKGGDEIIESELKLNSNAKSSFNFNVKDSCIWKRTSNLENALYQKGVSWPWVAAFLWHHFFTDFSRCWNFLLKQLQAQCQTSLHTLALPYVLLKLFVSL